MKVSKTSAGVIMLGGIVMVVFFGRVAAYAGGKVGSPADDFYYDCLGWFGTISAFAGLGLFFFAGKWFASK